ncbi:hypothetical protein HK102_006238 [Quaeritorhiza haematococci]|nr:hypothetical protein HK102_006238 [Quaeritorhiza haematococci]
MARAISVFLFGCLLSLAAVVDAARVLNVTRTERRIAVRSFNDADNSKALFAFIFGVNVIPHIRVSYFKTATDSDDKVAFTWQAGLLGVVEVNDTITAAQSQSRILFFNKGDQWSPITISNVTNDKGQVLRQAATTFTETGSQFSCKLTAKFTPLRAVYNNTTLRPASVKYDVEINNFPYQYENSRLLFVKGFFSAGARAFANDSSLTVGDTGYYNWVSSCETDKGNATITAEKTLYPETLFFNATGGLRGRIAAGAAAGVVGELDPPGSGKETLEIGFYGVAGLTAGTRPARIFWDPEVGVSVPVEDDGKPTSGASTMGHRLSMLSVCVAVVVTAFGLI